MSSVNASPVSRSKTTTRAVPERQAKRSSWPRSWKCSPRITPAREKLRFVCTIRRGSRLSRRSSQNQPRSSSNRRSGMRSTPSTLTGQSPLHRERGGVRETGRFPTFSRRRGRAGGDRCSPVGSGLVDEPADLRQVHPVLAGVLPPALDLDDVEAALERVVAIHVRDLELAAAR